MPDIPRRSSRDPAGRLVVRSHAAVVAVAGDPHTFSSAVSRYLQIPNGLDGTEHAAARRLLDPFFTSQALAPLLPRLQAIARALVAGFGGGVFDAVADLGARFAVRGQSAWLGWDPALEDELLDWVAANREATRAGDAVRTSEVARRFDAIIQRLLQRDRLAPSGAITTRLRQLRWDDGRALEDAELVSVLRNWTAGDLSSIALCAGVVVHWLASHPARQPELRKAGDADLDAVLDEMLRIDDPFVSNRRLATADAVVDGCPVAAGEVLVLDWRAANLDPDAFADPHRFDPEAHAARNLVYGSGPHACPGRPLATAELRVLVRALLEAGGIEFDPACPPVREQPPVAGYRSVHVRIVAGA